MVRIDGSSNARPDLYTSFISIIIADYMHFRLCKFDDAFLLELLDSLYDSEEGRHVLDRRSEAHKSRLSSLNASKIGARGKEERLTWSIQRPLK